MDIKSLRIIAECKNSEHETNDHMLNVILADIESVDYSQKWTRLSLKLPRIALISAISIIVIYSIVFSIGVALVMVIAVVCAFWLIEPEIDTMAGFSKESIKALKEYRINLVTSVFEGIIKELKIVS